MNSTTTSNRPGRAAGQDAARVLRRAKGAALVSEPRLQLAFDRATGDYALAML